MQLSRERSAREQEREREEEAERLEREHRRLAEAVRDFLPLVCSENKCLRVEGRVGKHVTKARRHGHAMRAYPQQMLTEGM